MMGISLMMKLIKRLSPAYRKVCELERAIRLMDGRQREHAESAPAETAVRLNEVTRAQVDALSQKIDGIGAALTGELTNLSAKLEAMGELLARRSDSVCETLQDDLSEMFDLQSGKLSETSARLEKCLAEASSRTGAAMHDGLAAATDNLTRKVGEVHSAVSGELAAVSAALKQRADELSAQTLTNIREACDTLFRNDIRCRWQIIDSIDSILFPPETKVKCRICGHVAARSSYETRVSECIFGGGRLERYVCPDCGAIFGPLKMMALSDNQLGEEYRQSYSVYRESDCTMLEKLAFEALKPQKNGVYLNYGAGAWNKTTKELREAGYEVYDYEPYAPAVDNPWLIRSFDELKKRTFDGIFSNDVIEHLEDPIRDLSAMRGLLKPQGLMAHCSGCYEYAFEYTRFHLAFFTGDSINRVAAAAGLTCQLSERLFPHSPARICTFAFKENGDVK